MQLEATKPLCYAVAFREGEKPVARGALVAEAGGLRLRGRDDTGPVELEVSYGQVTALRLAHRADERLNGYRTIVLEREARSPIRIAPLGFGCCSELAEVLGTRVAGRPRETEQIAIVVPLKPADRESVRTLIGQGPPFDAAALGLTRHEVFLTDDEAVFVLEGRDVEEILWRAVERPGFWRAGLAWRTHTAGAPRLSRTSFDAARAGELVYRWVANGSRPPDPRRVARRAPTRRRRAEAGPNGSGRI